MKLLKPTDPFYITQNFGVKSSMYSTYHHGVDIRVRNVPNKAIKCALGGTVYRIERSTNFSWYTNGVKNANYGKGSPYGVNVRIKSEVDGVTYYTLYAHLTDTNLEYGQEIKAGDLIGMGGTTGKSNGDHLHFEIRKGADQLSNAFNPTPYFVDSLETIPEWGKESWDYFMENKILSDKSVFDATITKGEWSVLTRRNNEFLLEEVKKLLSE